MPHQVHHEDDATAQDAGKQEILAGIIVADLVAQFLDPLLKGIFIDQDFGNDISDNPAYSTPMVGFLSWMEF